MLSSYQRTAFIRDDHELFIIFLIIIVYFMSWSNKSNKNNNLSMHRTLPSPPSITRPGLYNSLRNIEYALDVIFSDCNKTKCCILLLFVDKSLKFIHIDDRHTNLFSDKTDKNYLLPEISFLPPPPNSWLECKSIVFCIDDRRRCTSRYKRIITMIIKIKFKKLTKF